MLRASGRRGVRVDLIHPRREGSGNRKPGLFRQATFSDLLAHVRDWVVKRRYISGVVPIPPRRALPIKYFFACLSFGIVLPAFLVAFTCNIYLQICGGQRSESKDLIILLLELIVFPFVCTYFFSVFRFFLALTQFLSLCCEV